MANNATKSGKLHNKTAVRPDEHDTREWVFFFISLVAIAAVIVYEWMT